MIENMPENNDAQDILADILNDPHTGTIRGMAELSSLIHAEEVKSLKPRLLKPASKKVKKVTRKKRGKRKTTHYLTEEVFEGLGEAKEIIKEFLPSGSKTRATKSRIVESAIKVLLDEFERKGKESYLVKELLVKKKHD